MEIRQATINDIEVINNYLVNEQYKITSNDFNIDVTKILVPTINDEVVGFIKYNIFDNRVELDYLFINEKYRNIKIASKLMEILINDAKKNNCQTVILEVNINNMAAYSLYQKYDFKVIGKRKGYYNGVDALVMERKLVIDEK